VLAMAAPGNFSSCAPNVQPVQDRMMPCPIIGPLANDRVQLAPVVRRDCVVPIVEVSQDEAHSPPRTGVLNPRQEWQSLLDSRVCFFKRRPARILSEPGA